ncbi:MAG: tyrosine-type recombinase/integrase [Fischerella sp. CENA71]|nr:tyrosine-type recombinase/integrase [Fischerella sp. CENA71]
MVTKFKNKLNKRPKVTVEVIRKSLRLRFTYNSKQLAFHVGLKDNDWNRRKAQKIANIVSRDIKHDNFDESLARYKQPQHTVEIIDLEQLLSGFIEYKARTVSVSTIHKYQALLSQIKDVGIADKLPDELLESDIYKLIRFMEVSCNRRVIKERLLLLQACLRWADIESYELKAVIQSIKVPPKQPPKPFTVDEIRSILSYIPERYIPFVRFTLASGLRSGEARGLRWRHVCDTYIWIGECITHGKQVAAKNNKSRTVPLTGTAAEILRSLPKGEPDELIFTSPTGKAIKEENFINRVWKPALDAAGVPYRRFYLCRHTFVSHALQSGMKPVEVATITGHSVDVLYKNYAGVIGGLKLPEYLPK